MPQLTLNHLSFFSNTLALGISRRHSSSIRSYPPLSKVVQMKFLDFSLTLQSLKNLILQLTRHHSNQTCSFLSHRFTQIVKFANHLSRGLSSTSDTLWSIIFRVWVIYLYPWAFNVLFTWSCPFHLSFLTYAFLNRSIAYS